MRFDDSGLVLNNGFEQATAIVKDAFASRGFTVTTIESGEERNAARPGERRRYLRMSAVLPDVSLAGTESGSSSMLGCTLSVIELNRASTLVAADAPLASYPVLARLIPRVTRRVAEALQCVARHAVVEAA